jgi:ribonuclease III
MASKPDPLPLLEIRIGYRFVSRALLEEAVSHVSAARDGRSYQRLEFLGDRVLGLIVSSMLFEAFPLASEGELSKRLADLVRKQTCAEIARDWDLGAALRLGMGEKRSGARRKDAFLGDACEALIGAVYCDGGFEPADRLVRKAWEARMRAPVEVPRDHKTMLQEWAQGRGLALPLYRDIAREGPDHAPVFTVSVQVSGQAEVMGTGVSKRLAERDAAERAMAQIFSGEAGEERENE